jgi:LPXTG-motif cell wall-anchored protein
MSDKELLLVLGAAAILIIAAYFSTRRRKKLNSADYWLPDGSRVRRPKTDQALSPRCCRFAIGPNKLRAGTETVWR